MADAAGSAVASRARPSLSARRTSCCASAKACSRDASAATSSCSRAAHANRSPLPLSSRAWSCSHRRACSLEDVDKAAGKVADGIASRTDRAAARKRAIAEVRATLVERGVLSGGKVGMRLVRARHKLDGEWVEEPVTKEEES